MWVFFKIIYLFIYLCIYLWLCWVFVSVRGLSLVVASGGHSSSRCAGLSLLWPLLLRSTGSRRAGSAIVAHRPSRSAACGIFPDQGSNPCTCIGRQILNHCATREALHCGFYLHILIISSVVDLSMYLLAICMSSWKSGYSVPHFSIRFYFFFFFAIKLPALFIYFGH